MRTSLLLIFLLILNGTAFADTHTAEDCQNTVAHPHVQDAVDAAAANDTVAVPAGSCTWTSAVTVTKGIILQGSGRDTTLITSNLTGSGGLIEYQPSEAAVTADDPFIVTGFTIDLNDLSSGVNGVMLRNSQTTPTTKTRIHHNTFKNALSGGTKRLIYRIGLVNGVVDNNIFQQCNHCVDGEGTTTSWPNESLDYGSAANFYIEDNTFTNNDLTYAAVFSAAGTGGRYVIRYNTMTQTGTERNVTTPFDIHGGQYTTFGSMVHEVYGNNWTLKPINNGNQLMDQRGGKLLMFMNQLATHTATTGHYFGVREEYSDNLFPKVNSYTQHVNSSYYWANRNTTLGTLISTTIGAENCCANTEAWAGTHVYTANYCRNFSGDTGGNCWKTVSGGTSGGDEPNWAGTSAGSSLAGDGTVTWLNMGTSDTPLVANTDLWVQGASFDGSTGVGCGTLAARPATCTTGVGYWATSQSCSDLTGLVGTSPTTPISGTLYKCTSTNTWTAYYTPYTYPHPLRGPFYPSATTGAGPTGYLNQGPVVTIY